MSFPNMERVITTSSCIEIYNFALIPQICSKRKLIHYVIQSNKQAKEDGLMSLNNMLVSPPPVKPEGTIGLHSVRQSVCQSVCPSVCLSVCPSHSFSGLFFAILSHIWMKIGTELLYEELQIKFDFCHG